MRLPERTNSTAIATCSRSVATHHIPDRIITVGACMQASSHLRHALLLREHLTQQQALLFVAQFHKFGVFMGACVIILSSLAFVSGSVPVPVQLFPGIQAGYRL